MRHAHWFVMLLVLPALALAQVEFTTSTVAPSYTRALHVNCADLDGDGDNEIIGAGETANYFAYWSWDGDAWVETALIPNVNGPVNTCVVDLDQDGDLDIIAASYISSLHWFENDGAGGFTDHTISTVTNTKGIEAWDMDGDGDLDILATREGGGQVVMLENIGDDTNWPNTLIAAIPAACYLDVEDIDGDGDADIAVSTRSSGDVLWLENGGGFWTTHMLNASFGESRTCKVADMDGDGDWDVVACSRSDRIAWWENNGTPDGWAQHDVTTTFDGADDISIADIDGDGDLDIAAAGAFANQIAWFENMGDGSWTEHTVDPFLDYASGVWAGDVDMDGDIDILGAGYYANQIRLYDHVGTPNPDPVTLTLTPQGTTIPPAGGTLVYGVHLVSIVGISMPGLNFWTMATLPTGQTLGPLTSVPFNLVPFMDVEVVNVTQTVPGMAPGGLYTFSGYAGVMANPNLQVTDDFTFTKTGVAAGGVQNWRAGVLDIDALIAAGAGGASVELPAAFSLSPAWPNPFNPSTSLTLSLPSSGQATVTVFDVMGREVATLVDGMVSAGEHTISFVADDLPAGLYFVRAEAEGVRQVRKVTLVK